MDSGQRAEDAAAPRVAHVHEDPAPAAVRPSLASTLTDLKLELEIEKLKAELKSQQEKADLELYLLRENARQTRRGFLTSVVDKWMPAVISGAILFTLVPVANYMYWARQREIEGQIQCVAKRREVYAELAAAYTAFIAPQNQINRLRWENSLVDPALSKQQIPAASSDPFADDLYEIGRVRAELVLLNQDGLRERQTKNQRDIDAFIAKRSEAEPKLTRAFRETMAYYSLDTAAKANDLREAWGRMVGKRLTAKWMQDFYTSYDALIRQMSTELRLSTSADYACASK